MLLVIDIVLGPALTLIVYKPQKRSLKFDVATIVVLQLCALAYGVHTLFAGRPVYIAALGHRFDLVQASDVDRESILKSADLALPLFGPRLVGTRTPDDKKVRETIMFGGTELSALPQYHDQIENMRDELLRRAQPISRLTEHNLGEQAAIDRWIESRGMRPDQLVFQGLRARSRDMTVVLDAKTAKVVGIAPFKPWE